MHGILSVLPIVRRYQVGRRRRHHYSHGGAASLMEGRLLGGRVQAMEENLQKCQGLE